MRGKKKLLARIAKSDDLKFLRSAAEDLHTAADYAALADNVRDFDVVEKCRNCRNYVDDAHGCWFNDVRPVPCEYFLQKDDGK